MRSPSRLVSASQLVGLVALAVAAVIGLHRAGSLEAFQIDWADPVGWLARARVGDALVALLRLAGLATGWWVLGSTAVYVAARATGVPAAVRAVEWAALPPVRRLADRAVAVTIAGSSVLGGPAGAVAAAAEPPAPPVPAPQTVHVEASGDTVGGLAPEPVSSEVDGEQAEGQQAGGYEPTPAGSEASEDNASAPAGSEAEDEGQPPAAVGERASGGDDAAGSGRPPSRGGHAPAASNPTGGAGQPQPAASSETDTATSSRPADDEGASTGEEVAAGAAAGEAEGGEPAADEPGDDEAAPATHTVQRGEHLWAIAAAQLRQVRKQEPTGEEVAAYWRAVVAANADRLPSGDPDLVYPGDPVVLPEVPAD